ncbi:hypothetical protein GCM10023169_29970 [Georgenia halophila]|uniref:LexA-binding, inner membrane-associated hydrolase n=1 Tax=Georgenia halophila TaxID=620889 RepID=A0ABP8LGL5_9MICO
MGSRSAARHIPGHPDFQLGAWLLVLLMVAFAARALRLTRGSVSSWIVALAAATVAVWFAPAHLWWLPLAVGVGCVVHVAGDALTTQGPTPVAVHANPCGSHPAVASQRLHVATDLGNSRLRTRMGSRPDREPLLAWMLIQAAGGWSSNP